MCQQQIVPMTMMLIMVNADRKATVCSKNKIVLENSIQLRNAILLRLHTPFNTEKGE